MDADFSWSKNMAEPTLEGINLKIKKGELVGILGRVGAGKVSSVLISDYPVINCYVQSSLLSAIIGEMRRLSGETVVYGSIAYAPQNPW